MRSTWSSWKIGAHIPVKSTCANTGAAVPAARKPTVTMRESCPTMASSNECRTRRNITPQLACVDRYAARNANLVLVTFDRIAVLAARRAAREYWQPAKGLRKDLKGGTRRNSLAGPVAYVVPVGIALISPRAYADSLNTSEHVE